MTNLSLCSACLNHVKNIKIHVYNNLSIWEKAYDIILSLKRYKIINNWWQLGTAMITEKRKK